MTSAASPPVAISAAVVPKTKLVREKLPKKEKEEVFAYFNNIDHIVKGRVPGAGKEQEGYWMNHVKHFSWFKGNWKKLQSTVYSKYRTKSTPKPKTKKTTALASAAAPAAQVRGCPSLILHSRTAVPA
jgi:hypothetical protein